MKQQLIAYIVGAVVLAALIYHFVGNPGEREFKAQQTAIRGVKSWKMTAQISNNGRLVLNRIHEANCPDKEHITENSMGGYGEYLRVGDDTYWNRDQHTWTEGKAPADLFQPFPTPRPCLTNPAGYTGEINGIDEMDQYLQQIIVKGDIEKGAVEQVGGQSCRNWTAMAMNEQHRLVATTFCINEQDHLPLRVQMGGSINLAYQWNLPVKIEKPDLNPPAPVSDQESAPRAETPAQPETTTPVQPQ